MIKTTLSLKLGAIVSLLSFLLLSCAQEKNIVHIEKNIAFPSALVPFSEKEFLLLNTNAANNYVEGSIHRYKLDTDGNPILDHVFTIEEHASDMALSHDKKLLALSFDGSKKDTNLLFYDMSNKDNPQIRTPLTLKFVGTGSKQAIKQLHFFHVDGFADYFLYGVILSSKLDTGAGAHIPSRTFVAQISKNFSSAKILFVLSYGVGDDVEGTQTLFSKSDSLKQTFNSSAQYMFGSEAPTFDANHNLFIAFPTGSMNGDNENEINKVPKLPSALQYFSGAPSGNLNCPSNQQCVQPDLRAVSLMAVDMKNFLTHHSLNLSTYFIPLAWNADGIPFGRQTKQTIIGKEYPSEETNSFSFQTSFWASYWISSNSSILVAKNGLNATNDKGRGSEVFQIHGLDILTENIRQISTTIESNMIMTNDFKDIANRQIIDAYHCLNDNNLIQSNPEKNLERLSAKWSVNSLTQIQNTVPLSSYMYSRSSGTTDFMKTSTAVYNFNTACFDRNQPDTCFPYWARSSYLGLGNYGRDASWLTFQGATPDYKMGDNPLFPDASHDPTKFIIHKFKEVSGTRVCTTMQKSNIYCVSYLTGEFTKFHFKPEGFEPF